MYSKDENKLEVYSINNSLCKNRIKLKIFLEEV